MNTKSSRIVKRSISSALLDKSMAVILGKPAIYKLSVRRQRGVSSYYIGIEYDDTRCCRLISGGVNEAKFIFDVILRNKVTPCTIDDILNDMMFFQ